MFEVSSVGTLVLLELKSHPFKSLSACCLVRSTPVLGVLGFSSFAACVFAQLLVDLDLYNLLLGSV